MKKMYLFLFLVFIVKLNFATLVVTITNPTAQVDTICQGTNINLSCSVTGATSSVSYVWKINYTQVSTNATYNFVAATTGYNVCIVTATSGTETSLDTVVLVVVPTPTISNITDSLCSGSSFTITPTGVPVGTTYSWNIPTVTGNDLGGASGSGNSIYGTLTNPTNTAQVAVYTVIPTSGAGCVGATFLIYVAVYPVPSIPNIIDTVCSGTSFTITPTGVPSGTTYSWPYPAITGNISGGAAGNGNSIYGTLTNPTNTAQVAGYYVTPTSGAGCVGATFLIYAAVYPVPEITTITPNPICSGVPFSVTPVNGTDGLIPLGTTYSWGYPVGTGAMTAGATGNGASSINGLIVNGAPGPGIISYSVIPISGAGCVGDTFVVNVTILPALSANFTLVADTTTPHHYFAINNAAGGVPPLQYVWSWGDGTANSTTAYPSHTYSVAGYYIICLTITDSTGCTNTYCDSSYLQKSTNSIISVDVIQQGTLGINEKEISNQIKLYPNPAKETLTIETDATNQKLEIINLLGETIHTIYIYSKATINTSAFANGIYIIKIPTLKGTIVRKFVKE